MTAVHFFENNNLVLSQLLNHVPSVGENIKIKGRKGKVSSVKKIEENIIHVYVTFEQVVTKKNTIAVDNKKKKK